MKLVLSLFLLICFAPFAFGQDDEKAAQDADAILAAVDARVYRAGTKGLEGFRFRMAMDHGTGIFKSELAGKFMELSYQAPGSWRTRIVDAEGKPMEVRSELLDSEKGKEFLALWRSQLMGTAQHLLIGLSWKDRYQDFHKQVKSYQVNDKLEYRLTMNPRKKSAVTTVVLKIASGLPREIVQIDEKGSRYVARYIWEGRDDLDGLQLLVGTKHEADNVQVLEESYEYVTRKGLILLHKVNRLHSEGDLERQSFLIENFELNPEFPADWFPTKEPAAPEKKPKSEEGGEGR